MDAATVEEESAWPWLVTALVLLAAAVGGFVVYKARGLRNRNPGNIRPLANGQVWDGQVGIDNGPGGPFVKFSSFFYGLRALARVLMTYQTRHGLRTVEQMIGRWAPSVENNTSQYVAVVSKALNVTPDASIDVVNDRVQLVKLMAAIVRHENGLNPFSQAQLDTPAQAARVGVA